MVADQRRYALSNGAHDDVIRTLDQIVMSAFFFACAVDG
jgi:hypothetical protein